MGDLFDALRSAVDMSVSPTLAPRGASLTGEEIERRRRLDSSAVSPSIITSPFVEPERPAEIGAVTSTVDHRARDARYLEAVRAAGRLGLSDAEAAIKLRLEPASICSARALVRLDLWFARRVHGAHGVRVNAWRIATPDEQARNRAHERALAAAGKRWTPIVPTIVRPRRRRR